MAANDIDINETLLLMSNPNYLAQAQAQRQHKDKETLLTSENRRFYKKRTIQLFKDLFLHKERKKYPEYMRLQFEGFMSLAIQHFQRQDREEIFQNEYSSLELHSETSNPDSKLKCHKSPELSPIHEAEEITRTFLLPQPGPREATLENFIIRQKPTDDEDIDDEATKNRNFPKMKEVNLHTEALRIKGVKHKKSKA